MIGLTRRQLEVAQMIQECLDNGYSVSIKEIAEEFELSSGSLTQKLLCRLRERGIIAWLPHHKRSIEMLVRVPEIEEYEFRLLPLPEGVSGLAPVPMALQELGVLAQLLETFRQLDHILIRN